MNPLLLDRILKILPYILGIIVVVIILWIVFKKLGKIGKTDLEKDLKKEIDKKNLSFDSSKYNEMADILYTAMKGWGTDFPAVESVLTQLKTADDWKQLQVSFGKRDNENLVQWLIDDVDSAEVNEMIKQTGAKI